MNKLTTFFLVFLLLLVGVSCTEEISQELKNSDEASRAPTSATEAVGNKISITHKMPENLSYHIHSTKGRDFPCELESTGSNFSSSSYEKSDSKDVTDCILEVEELDLFFEGVEFEINVDEYLCEYVQYRPFKFFQYPVGSTTQIEYEVKCDSSCSAASDSAASFCANIEGTYLTYDSSTKVTSTSSTTGEFTNQSAASCRFDYSNNGGPNCDVGAITKYVYNIFPEYNDECTGDGPGVAARTTQVDCELAGTWTEASCSDGTSTDIGTCTGGGGTWNSASCDVAGRSTSDQCTSSGTWGPVAYCGLTDVAGTGYDNNIVQDVEGTEITECDGDTLECLNGPSLEHLSDKIYIGEIYDNKDLSTFTKSWVIKPSISEGRGTNMYMANYSRICSNNQVKASYYDNVITSATGLVGDEVETHTPSPKNPYDSTDPTQVYQVESVDYNNDGNNDYQVYNDHPLLGVISTGVSGRNSVMPYYGFYCLDKARDVKAQIRLFIREWDRMFDKDESKMEYVSDVDDPNDSARLIDNDNYYDDDIAWNNFYDWDDFFSLNWSDFRTPDSKFTADQCGALVYETNPGACWRDNGDAEAACTDPNELWVDRDQDCYSLAAGAGEDQSSKSACEADSDNMWVYDISGQSSKTDRKSVV